MEEELTNTEDTLKPIKFEVGKYYRHIGPGGDMATLCFAETTMWGRSIIAEIANPGHTGVSCVGWDSTDYAQGWYEITKDEWMSNFTKD